MQAKSIERGIYKRGNSLETTLPKPLILHFNLDDNFCAVFKVINSNRTLILFEDYLKTNSTREIRRRVYNRSGSYEVTIPKELLFTLDENKPKKAIFEFENNQWYLKLKNE
ncbi:hypothetical protein J4403_00555 [Candidatus Woesearchaeota archaeon]|nr:hypothetical protein [Candidatus Woesearchaeota archaeon]